MKTRTFADRPLLGIDSIWFEGGEAVLNVMFLVHGTKKKFRSKTLHGALHQAIRMSPIAQTEVKGDGEDARFSQLSSSADWPALELIDRNSDTEAKHSLQMFVKENTAAFAKNKDLRRSAFKIAVARGKTLVAVGFVAPHHFFDGAAIASFVSKFLAYALFPRPFWFMLNRLSSLSKLPTLTEMALKDQHKHYEQVDGSLDKKFEQGNFLPGYLSLDEEKDFVFQEELGRTVNASDLVGISMKKKGVTITTVFLALSVKLMAKFSKYSNLDKPKSILADVGVDTRRLGSWGDARDLRNKFPEIGNYTIGVTSQVPFEDALEDSIEDIALRIKKDCQRVQTDVDFRMHSMEACGKHIEGSGMCGVSSVAVPKASVRLMRRLGIPGAEIERFKVPNFVSHIWFDVITFGNKTTVTVAVGLPIPALTEEIVRQTIKESVKGTTIGPLFNSLCKDIYVT